MIENQKLCSYLSKIRQTNKVDVHTIVNTTLVANPYITQFPEDFLFEASKRANTLNSFFINTCIFYALNFLRILKYLYILFHFKISYRKPKFNIIKTDVIVDLYVNVDSIVKNNAFTDQYFSGLYPVLREEKCNYVFVPRLIGVSHNPLIAYWQLVEFFKIINQDENKYLFEFELFTVVGVVKLIWLYFCYPFKTLRLLSKNNTITDRLFNFHLMNDISKQSIVPFSRFIFGENLFKAGDISQIYSWSEFQVTERAFNYAIRKTSEIKINACQFLLSYPTHFNMHVQDIDEIQRSAPNRVLVNGVHYLLERQLVDYQLGVSLRYKDIFRYPPHLTGTKILLLGSYSVNETTHLLKMTGEVKGILFKGHPLVSKNKFLDVMSKNITLTDENIYNLFPKAALVVGSASGSLIEAISCGISILVVGRNNKLLTNPMAAKGKGKMWDIAYTPTEVETKIKELILFRTQNKNEILEIACWYRNNLFVEPTKTKIKQTFELN